MAHALYCMQCKTSPKCCPKSISSQLPSKLFALLCSASSCCPRKYSPACNPGKRLGAFAPLGFVLPRAVPRPSARNDAGGTADWGGAFLSPCALLPPVHVCNTQMCPWLFGERAAEAVTFLHAYCRGPTESSDTVFISDN